MNRKLWPNEEKVAVVLEILHGDETAAAICTRYGVSATQAYRWLDRFLEGVAVLSRTNEPEEVEIPCWKRTVS